MATEYEFQPDDADTAKARNQALADLLTMGGVWHDYDAVKLERFDTDNDKGWQIEFTT